MEKKNLGVESVDKALQILNAFSEKREELTLTEISKQINQYKSTTSRLCASSSFLKNPLVIPKD